MKPASTALVLIGYQDDYFGSCGALRDVIEAPARANGMLENTVATIASLSDTETLIVSTPILFTQGYPEIPDPIGVLETIVRVGAFQAGSPGAETIPELRNFGDRIQEIVGKTRLDAFRGTHLDQTFSARGITDVVLAGVITSLCIDSTARSALELGYRVTVLSDCTAGRTTFEQQFFCKELFPLYARVASHHELVRELTTLENPS